MHMFFSDMVSFIMRTWDAGVILIEDLDRLERQFCDFCDFIFKTSGFTMEVTGRDHPAHFGFPMNPKEYVAFPGGGSLKQIQGDGEICQGLLRLALIHFFPGEAQEQPPMVRRFIMSM